MDNLNTIIVSVVRYTHWSPETIDQLYLDDLDHHGLLFWYNDAKEENDKIKDAQKGSN